MNSPEETGKVVRPRRLELVGTELVQPVRPWWRDLPHNIVEFGRQRPWFLVVVALPSLLAILYFGLIASDQYESETRFVVRSANQVQISPLASFLQSTGFSSASGDAFSVVDFIESRDIVRKLDQQQNLRAILSRPEADFIDRFPPPLMGSSFERLYETYQRYVDVNSDGTTGIVTLRVRAFRPQDARKLSLAILNLSEDLVNRLNNRAKEDMIGVARSEVDRYEARVRKAQTDMMAYRLSTNMLDPASSSNAILQLVAQLSTDRSGSEEQLGELMKTSPDSPQIGLLRNHIAALDNQIALERKKVIGDNGSIAQEIGRYEDLTLQREFADKGLASAISSLEAARVEAEHKQLYLERVVEPNLPDFPLYPHRLYAILEVLISTVTLYGVGWLVTASIREHVGR